MYRRESSVFRALRQGAGKVLRHRSGPFYLCQPQGFSALLLTVRYDPGFGGNSGCTLPRRVRHD